MAPYKRYPVQPAGFPAPIAASASNILADGSGENGYPSFGPGLSLGGDDGIFSTNGTAVSRASPAGSGSGGIPPGSNRSGGGGSNFFSDLRAGGATGPEDDILHIPFPLDADLLDEPEELETPENGDSTTHSGHIVESSIFSLPFPYFSSPTDAPGSSEPKLSLFSDLSAFGSAGAPGRPQGPISPPPTVPGNSMALAEDKKRPFDELPALTPIDPRRALRSVPEDWNLDSSRCVVCYNIPPDYVKKQEIANFFNASGCDVAVDKSLSPMVWCLPRLHLDAGVSHFLLPSLALPISLFLGPILEGIRHWLLFCTDGNRSRCQKGSCLKWGDSRHECCRSNSADRPPNL